MELFSIPKFKSILNEKKANYIADAIKMLEVEQKKLSEYIDKEKNTFILFRRYTNRDLKKLKHKLELISSDLDSLKKSQAADAKAVNFKFFDNEDLLLLNYIDFKSYIPTMEYHTYKSIRNLIVLYNLNFCDIHKIDYFDKVRELAIETVNCEGIIEEEILKISTYLRTINKDKTNLGYVLDDENNNAALILTVYDGD